MLVHWAGQETVSESGTTPGVPLSTGQLLRQGDRITVIACGMVSNLIRDGMVGRFGVNDSVCKGTMVVGGTGAESGFRSAAARFV